MEKPTPEIIQRFEGLLPDDPRVERRAMFGMPCAFVHGQMFLGTFEDTLVVRVGAERAAALHGEPGLALFTTPRGGAWRQHLRVSPTLLVGDPLPGLVAEALRLAASAPPKAPRAPRKRAIPSTKAALSS